MNLDVHADSALDAMASLITTELRLYRAAESRAPTAVRDRWLRRAVGALPALSPLVEAWSCDLGHPSVGVI